MRIAQISAALILVSGSAWGQSNMSGNPSVINLTNISSNQVAYGNPGASVTYNSPGPTSWSPPLNVGGSNKIWTSLLINVNSFPDSSRNLIVAVAAPLITEIFVPPAVTAVGHGMDNYALCGALGTVCIGNYSVGLSGGDSQLIWGSNPNANDYDADHCGTGLCTSHPAAFVNASEGDTGIRNSGTQRRHNMLAEFRPNAKAQANTIDASFFMAKDANSIGAITFTGTGPNAMLNTPNANYTGFVNTTYCVMNDGAATFKWAFFASSTCHTGTDGVGTSAGTLFSSASHYFTDGDVSGTTRVQITAGTGANLGTYTIASVAGGVATLGGDPGTGTGFTFVLWQATGVAASGVVNELIMPADVYVGYLQGQNPRQFSQILRPVASSYGMGIVWNPAAGLTVGDYYTFSVTGVPPAHFAFASDAGAADIGIDLAALNAGTSQNSQPIYLHATGSTGLNRSAVLQNLFNSAGSVFSVFFPNTATSGVALISGASQVAAWDNAGGQALGLAGTSTGTLAFKGATSGSVSIGAQTTAGTPAAIGLPSATGGAGQFLQTDGGTPQVTSWHSLSNWTSFCDGTIGAVLNTEYVMAPFQNVGVGCVTATGVALPAPVACTPVNMYVFSSAGGKDASSGVVTLYKGGVGAGAAALTCTLGTGTSCTATGGTTAYSAGNQYYVAVRTSTVNATDTTANLRISIDCH